MILIENDGQKIIKTNYWKSEIAQAGYCYMSINAGCFRLLLPETFIVDDIQTGIEVIITRGPWPTVNIPDALEILFEDNTDDPYAIHVAAGQVDRFPMDTDQDQSNTPPRWKFMAYAKNKLVHVAPARYRKVKKLPCLKKWK